MIYDSSVSLSAGIIYHTCFQSDMLSSSLDNTLLSKAYAFTERCV